MNNERTYVYYQNRRVPGWWIDYLPKEKNPYKASDTLTLQKGCLSEYWYIHSSNKHPNHRGVEACNFVRSLIRERFGGAFLTTDYYHRLGSRAGVLHTYHEPEHLVYENAYIGEDGNIHIQNAKKYYEDVTRFVMYVLGEIAKNHMQSGNSYHASKFFPYRTDQQIEKDRIEAERKRATKVLEITFGFYLQRKATKDTNTIILPLAEDKVSESVKKRINDLCNGAMEDYNKTHIDMIETTNPAWRYYPCNIFF